MTGTRRAWGAGWVVLALAIGCGRPAVVEAPLAPSEAGSSVPVARKAPGPDRAELVAPRPQEEEGTVAEEILRSIHEISPTEHIITRRSVELFLEHQPELMQTVRVVPETQAGVTKGIRLFGVRPDELLGRLGFENGDRLDSLMGKPVGTPEQALEAYAAMRGAAVIDIAIVRRGAPKQLIVRVVE
jgi:general secretion pathway protein C